MAHPFEQEHGQPPIVTGGSERPPVVVTGEMPPTLRLQPRPIGLIHQYQEEYDQTIFTLNWNPGDAARCRFCLKCTANRHNTCQLVVPGKIQPTSSALFGVRDR